MYNEMSVEDWCYLIEDYALHKLKVSDSEEDKVLYEDIKLALRSLGFILTEKEYEITILPLTGFWLTAEASFWL